MKKFLLVPLLALGLGGCVTTGGGGQVVVTPVTPVVTPPVQLLTDIQHEIAQVCGVVVPVARIGNVLVGLVGDEQTVVTADLVFRAVSAFCGSLTPQQARVVRVKYQRAQDYYQQNRYQNLGDGLEYGG